MGKVGTIENSVRLIELWPHTDFCCVCEDEVIMEYGLAMYESDIVPNDWPGEWGGFTACRSCFNLFNDIKQPLSIQDARKLLPHSEAIFYPH